MSPEVLTAPSTRELEVMRLIHGGMHLVSRGTNVGHLVNPGAETVRPSMVTDMLKQGWLEFSGNRWKLTELGKEMVRVRDDVGRYVTDLKVSA